MSEINVYTPQVGGTSYTFRDSATRSMITADFSASATYAPNDLVIYNKILYRCIAAHTGAWDATHFTSTTINNEVVHVSVVPNTTGYKLVLSKD